MDPSQGRKEMRPVGELGLGVSAAREPETYVHKRTVIKTEYESASSI